MTPLTSILAAWEKQIAEAPYFCNKCGFYGPDLPDKIRRGRHGVPGKENVECGYVAVRTNPIHPARVLLMIEALKLAEKACGYALDEMNEVSPSKQGMEPGRWYTAIDRMKKLDAALQKLGESK